MPANSIPNRPGSGPKQPASRQWEERPHEHTTASRAMEHATDYVSAGVERGREQVEGMVQGREGMAVAVALAAGFGVGIAIGCALAAPHRRPATWRDRFMAEGIGRRVMERMEAMLPQSVTDCMSK